MELRYPKLATYNNCMGCMLCADICPKKAIRIEEDYNGFWMPIVDSEKCIKCFLCEKSCVKVRSIVSGEKCNIPLKGYCLDDNLRSNSASGGAFSALANYAISRKNAIVYGATLQNNHVFHISIDRIEDIRLLQGSKYIQSRTTGVFISVKKALNQEKFVLFSGTPCQVNALRVFLEHDYDNLLTIDLICHGVVSNRIFKRHIEKNECGEIVAFRDKTTGWGKDCFFREIRNGKPYVDYNWRNNYFYHVFQAETCMRPNCYKCQFCKTERVSDITIGDYWADRKNSNYNVLGISTILCNTQKGLAFVSSCKLLHTECVDWFSTIAPNPRLLLSRKSFLRFSCSSHINSLYRWLSKNIADNIVGVWRTKRLLPFWLWLLYINHIRKEYDSEYECELERIKQEYK